MRKDILIKSFIYLAVVIMAVSCKTASQAQVDRVLNDFGKILNGEEKLSTGEVIKGLKEALSQGITNGSDQASAVDGYLKNNLIRIAFPPDAAKVETRLRQIGLGSEVDKFIVSLNRGAEKAAKEAKPIFLEAIRNMTIEDAWGILRGEEDSATRYLEFHTSAALTEKFQPIIASALDQVNATRYYDDLVNTYNKIPLVQKADPDLEQYATQQAISGLFKLIAEEEANIRRDPAARTTALLKKVFGDQL
jgi:hypothetical protein